MSMLQASTRPLIQVKVTSAFFETDTPGKTRELPEEQEERVELLMMPDPTSRSIKDEKINSPTRLLAATWAFRISNILAKVPPNKRYRMCTVWGPSSWQPA